MKNLVITVHENGNASCLHTDAIPLDAIGTMEIERASTIEFNNATQLWEVKWSNSADVVFTAKTRAECVTWEIETLQSKMMDGQACPIPRLTAEQHNAFPQGRFHN